MLTNAALSAALNVVILAGLPFLGDSAAFTVAHVAVLRIWPLPLEPFVREGSATASFVGLGSGGIAVTAALLYGVPERRGPDRLGLTLGTSPAPPAVSFPGGP